MIRLSKASISDREIAAVSAVLKEEYLGLGPQVQAFEQELSSYFGGEPVMAACTMNGTSALQLALQAVGVGAEDEVLVPSLTYVASYQAISATGATPVSCDVCLESALISLQDAEQRLTKQSRVIMPVHYAGNGGDLSAVYNFALRHKLRVIEDAAHAFGTTYKNKLIGSQGDIACFSFDGIKNITCGEGGAVISADPDVISRVRDLRLLGVMKDSDQRYAKKRSWDFDVQDQGWRYHMSDIMAAIGRVQLSRFNDEFRTKRMLLAKMYRAGLQDIPNIALLTNHADNDIVPHIMPIRVLNGMRDRLRDHLLSKDIQIGMHYKPNHLLKKYANPVLSLPATEQLYAELLTLPLHVDLEPSQLENIVKEIASYMGSRT